MRRQDIDMGIGDIDMSDLASDFLDFDEDEIDLGQTEYFGDKIEPNRAVSLDKNPIAGNTSNLSNISGNGVSANEVSASQEVVGSEDFFNSSDVIKDEEQYRKQEKSRLIEEALMGNNEGQRRVTLDVMSDANKVESLLEVAETKSEVYELGRQKGRAEGLVEGFIQAMFNIGLDLDEISNKLVLTFNITKEKAESYLREYYKTRKITFEEISIN